MLRIVVYYLQPKLDQLELIHCVYEATEADEKEAFDCTGESNHLKSFLLNEISDTTGFIDEHVPVASAIHNQECPEVHFLFSTVDGNTGRVYSDFLNDVNQLVTLREKE